MSPKRRTLRALLGHGDSLADVGYPLFAFADEYGIKIESLLGGPNSWYIVDPERHLKGVPSKGYVEVRETFRGPVKLILKTKQQVERWLRNGCPL